MKVAVLLFILLGMEACNDQRGAIKDKWVVLSVEKQQYTYNKSGLPDKIYRMSTLYEQGQAVIVSKDIIVKEYNDKNKISCEKTFELPDTTKPDEQSTFTYDNDNNLIASRYTDKKGVFSVSKIQYRNKRKIQGFFVQRIPDAELVTYDTTMMFYVYDKAGKLIETIERLRNGEIRTSTFLVYNNSNERISSYNIDANGDTVGTTQYKKIGNSIDERMQISQSGFFIDTSWYKGDKVMRSIFVSGRRKLKNKEIFEYDARGNKISHISYKQD